MKNIGSVERVVRGIVAIILLSLVVVLHGSVRWFGLLGLIPLMTSITGVCPLYSVLHISTVKK